MAFAAAALPFISAAAGVGGALVSGAASANAADYQAKVAENNATIAQQNADAATQAGETQAAQKSRQGAERQSAVKAAIAANGLDVNTGSPVDVEAGGREVAATDTETTLHNALLTAYGYRTQETGYEAQAGLDTQASSAAEIGGDIGAAGSFLNATPQTGNIGSKIANLFSSSSSSGGDSAIPAGSGFAVSP